MKAVLQRSKHSNVSVEGKIVGEIDFGLVVLVGFTINDDIKDIEYLVDKILNLRIFDDENGVMNRSVLDIKGEILSISQFTLYADSEKGRRPSYINALNPTEANELYELFNQKLNEKIIVKTGIFRSNMEVSITNDGPVTIILESRKK